MIADRSQPTLMMKSKRRRRGAIDSRNLPARQNCAVCSPLSSGSEYIDSSLLHAIKSLAEAGPPSSSLSLTKRAGTWAQSRISLVLFIQLQTWQLWDKVTSQCCQGSSTHKVLFVQLIVETATTPTISLKFQSASWLSLYKHERANFPP